MRKVAMPGWLRPVAGMFSYPFMPQARDYAVTWAIFGAVLALCAYLIAA